MPRGDGLSWADPRWYSSPICLPQWLNEEKIVQRLIEQIHPSRDDNVSAGKGPLRGGWWWWRRAAGVCVAVTTLSAFPPSRALQTHQRSLPGSSPALGPVCHCPWSCLFWGSISLTLHCVFWTGLGVG